MTTTLRSETGVSRTADRLLATIPAYPLLLSAYPVLRLCSDNVHKVPGTSVLVPLLLTVGISAPLLLGLAGPA